MAERDGLRMDPILAPPVPWLARTLIIARAFWAVDRWPALSGSKMSLEVRERPWTDGRTVM